MSVEGTFFKKKKNVSEVNIINAELFPGQSWALCAFKLSPGSFVAS